MVIGSVEGERDLPNTHWSGREASWAASGRARSCGGRSYGIVRHLVKQGENGVA